MTVTDTLPSAPHATDLRDRLGLHLGDAELHAQHALAAGAAYPAITLTVNVASNAPASVTNTASVSGGGDINGANNTVNDPTTIVPPTTVRVFLVAGSTWTVPGNWNSANNTIEVIGGGGGGANGTADGHGASGGGAAYAKAINVTLTPNATVAYAIGAAGAVQGAGGDTWFCNSTASCASIGGGAVVAGARGGTGASGMNPGTGGQAASSRGTVTFSGEMERTFSGRRRRRRRQRGRGRRRVHRRLEPGCRWRTQRRRCRRRARPRAPGQRHEFRRDPWGRRRQRRQLRHRRWQRRRRRLQAAAAAAARLSETTIRRAVLRRRRTGNDRDHLRGAMSGQV